MAWCKNRKFKWSGFAYEAKDFRGDLIFSGGASSVSASYLVAVQDAIVEASIKARLWFQTNFATRWIRSMPREVFNNISILVNTKPNCQKRF